MKVLVTGGNGFIGRYVAEELSDRGHIPVIFDRYNRNLITRGESFLGDVLDDVAVVEAAAHVDGIIHLAAVLGTQETIMNPRPSAIINIAGSLNVFEAASQYRLPIVYAGVGNHWMREHGGGSYTISKTCVEDYAKMYNRNRAGAITVVRPMNAYGPRQSVAAPYGSSKVRKIMPAFICRALVGEPIEIYGDGTQVSDCVYVQDVARCFVKAWERTYSDGPLPTIDVGPRESHTVNEIATLVRDAVGSTLDVIHLPMRPGEVPNAVVKANTENLTVIDEAPEKFTPLGEGIMNTVMWFSENWLPKYLETSHAR